MKTSLQKDLQDFCKQMLYSPDSCLCLDSDSDFDLSINSSLHPYSSKATVLVRFTAGPIYASNDSGEAHPIAALLLGDIVNGKFGVIDTSSRQFGNGKNTSVN